MGGREFIVIKDPNFRLPFQTPPGTHAIAENGRHFGVQVGFQVFDNVFKSGISRREWDTRFDCDVHSFSVTSIEPF